MSPIPDRFFSSLLPELATRAARATVSRLSLSNSALRQHLLQRFSADIGEPGSFLAEPVFEATFGWETAGKTLKDLRGGTLSAAFLDAMSRQKPGHDLPERPYRHQLEAWEWLSKPEPHSVVVTSGTGSGKTECFMVPILDDLARQAEGSSSPLEGVQALFLYPLNALIDSQKERLSAWTEPFDGRLRFSLYNGRTPERPLPAHERTSFEVSDRISLRDSPSPILVTNATMLEYMLVRAQDAPIRERSKGQLKWIVLDEAHSYIGSQAAELALLLRRVLHGFGVNSNEVRFVATSATIGDPNGKAGEQLKQFLADLAGVPPERVHLVAGRRTVPSLPPLPSASGSGLDELEAVPVEDATARYQVAVHSRRARELRGLFLPSSGKSTAVTLTSVCTAAFGPKAKYSADEKQKALRWLDALTSAIDHSGKRPQPFLPLRLHAFHNVLPGLWACCDRQCRCRKGSALDADEWPFGAVYTEQREACDCGAPVFELRSCNECNESVLLGLQVDSTKHPQPRLIQELEVEEDDFQLDEIEPVGEGEEGEEPEEESEKAPRHTQTLIAAAGLKGVCPADIEFGTRLLNAPGDTPRARIHAVEVDGEQRLKCPSCGAWHGQGQKTYRAARLGGPFLMLQVVPTLLEYCADGDAPQNTPWRGRRLITFTDSRQGTARVAATLQRAAEHNCVRALVYRKVMPVVVEIPPEEQEADRRKLERLRGIDEQLFAAEIASLEEKLNGSGGVSSVSFQDLANYLALHEEDIKRWALQHYQELSPQQFPVTGGAMELAKLFLFREFGRRPKHASSLETLGLVAVTYPKLLAVQSVPPGAKVIPRITLEEWRAFLKLTMDFVVRESSCIEFKEEWRRWVGKKTVSAEFMAPGSKDAPTGTKRRWPEARKGAVQHRLVRMLAESSNLDPKTDSGMDSLNGVLRSAWDDLIKCGLLRSASGGSYLALEDLAFAPITKAWLCPVTRRVLDTTWRELSPYVQGKDRKAAFSSCQRIDVPAWPEMHRTFPTDGVERLAAARAWLSSNERVIQLREMGAWSNLNDRFVEGVRYFRAAEHSAQQSSERLGRYVEEFKAGKINLLSCSTTMEMGVDIGGISMVAMNNVPPHPANYLQRVGRAGRRSETRSVGLTMCKANPHDQQVFAQPLWPFITELPAPAISLESPVIVQRHVNAMLLADFLWRQVQGQASLEKLTMEWWGGPQEDGSQSDRFVAWAKSFEPAAAPGLAAGLQMLLKGSCFDRVVPIERLAGDAAAAMEALMGAWTTELGQLEGQLAKFSGRKEKEPAYRALEIQKKRLTQEYLLRELATDGFLPGYGFPTNIAAFDTLNVEELLRQESRKKASEGREDNRMCRRELPSRDAVVALREYAPGADVVIDGMVYRSDGITLNWHAPASEVGVKEIQSIRRGWRCSACGASGTCASAEELHSCQSCGTRLDQVITYLQPSGFAVDLYEPTHTDVAETSYVPVESPWINAGGDWLALPNPRLGLFRMSSQGKVFNRSSGVGRRGYAICLECGRAAPMPAAPDASVAPPLQDLPKVFHRPHRRLRGAQGGETAECAGSHKSYVIKPFVHLGLEETTDVMELQLNHLSGIPLSDPDTALSIAVALRNAVAASLGVESDEIGCDVKPIRLANGTVASAIALFDHEAAGYCSSIAPRIPELLRNARDRFLNCRAGCSAACQHCLAGYDTRFRLKHLDRLKGIDFLSNEWLAGLQLPAEHQHFGSEASWAETQPLIEAITREWDRPGSAELRLFLAGDSSDWDFSAPGLRRALERWANRGPIALVMSEPAMQGLTAEQRWSLSSIASLTNLSVHAVLEIPEHQLAQVRQAERVLSWASSDALMAAPGAHWGLSHASTPLVRGFVSKLSALGKPLVIAMDPPAEMAPTAGRVEFRGALAKSAIDLGKAFWSRLSEEAGGPLFAGEAAIESVLYRDRYLNAPLPVALLVSVLKALKELAGTRWTDPRLSIATAELPRDERYQQPNQVFHNWQDGQARLRAIEHALGSCSSHVDVRELSKQVLSHARTMEVSMRDGKKLRLWLDQGFGYWVSPRPSAHSSARLGRSTFFRFDDPPSSQGERIAAGGFDIEGQPFPTHVFFERT